jgi:hypothetical protein
MSNLADLLKDIADENATPIQLLGDSIGTIADLAGTVGFVVSVVDLLIGNGGDTKAQLQQILTTIQNDFALLAAAQNAENIIARLTNQVNALGDAQAVLDSLKGLLIAQPPLTSVQANDEIQKCVATIDKLSPDIIWTVVFSDQIYWTDAGVYTTPIRGTSIDAGYGEQAPFGSGQDLVFSYTYILPAYLDALFIFLTVAGSLDQNFVTDYTTVIEPAATLLKTRHDTILNPRANVGGAFQALDVPEPLSGIVPLLPYTLNVNANGNTFREPWHWDGQTISNLLSAVQQQGAFGPPGVTSLSGFHSGVNIEYGAVDVFSGYSSMADYNLIFSDDFPANSTDPAPFNKFSIRVLRRAKNVYTAVGLGKVWTIVNDINRLIGDPLMPRPNFGDWSFRAITGSVAAPDGSVSLKAFASFLKNTPPLDTAPSLSTSFQNLLSPPTFNPVGGPPF